LPMILPFEQLTGIYFAGDAGARFPNVLRAGGLPPP
jgi:hypothetical protein